MATKYSRQTQGTPGRRVNITSNQYFDIGRVGRKTGVTLKDTGIRDDYGLEPLSDIFSTPGSAGRFTFIEDDDDEQDDGSADMVGLSSPGQEVSDVIQRRQTSGRLTPPRQINTIGRSSAVRPDTSRRLQFNENVRNSIEKQSPFKPKHVLRRSNIGDTQQLRRSTNGAGAYSSSPGVGPSQGNGNQYTAYEDAYQDALDDEGYQEEDTLRYSTRDELEGALGHATMLVHSSPITPQKKRRTQEHSSEVIANNRAQPTPRPPTSNKRPRYSAEDVEEIDATLASAAAPSSRKLEKAPMYDQPQDDLSQEQPLFIDDNNDLNDYDDDEGGSLDLPDVEDYNDEDVVQPSVSPQIMSATDRAKQNRRKQTTNSSPRKFKVKIKAPPQQSRRRRAVSEPSSEGESDYDSDASARRQRRGTVSNMRYRSTTPFEDAAHKTTRSGRAVMKPLDWWAGEAVIWKNGEVDGVIRANSVEPAKQVNKKQAAHKKKTAKIRNGLGAIDEQDEELLPDDWEEDIGVYTGEVATWDPLLKAGNDSELVTEDLAFAASSIITQSVDEDSYSYAKIQTLPFFGSGIVEIPPNGVKNTKNSKMMQMNFFVHKGKVEVMITTPTKLNPEPLRSTIFTITEGGAWIVPRGNNYTIYNSSSTTTAFLFFSQGNEVTADMVTSVS